MVRDSLVYRGIRRGATISLLAGAVLLSTGCEQITQALLGIEYPTGFEASDGGSADTIEISWNEISDTDAGGNERTLDYYVLKRDGMRLSPGPGTSTSYTDYGPPGGFEIGQLYDYSVYAVFVNGSSTQDAEDTGYVMDARSVLIHHIPFVYSYRVSSDTRWFTLHAQEGWTYRAYTTDGAVPIRLMRSGDLVETAISGHASNGIGSYATFRFDESHVYYLEVAGSGSVSITHE